VRLWQVQSGHEIRRFEGHESPKDSLISRLTLQCASRHDYPPNEARSPFSANKRSNYSDLALQMALVMTARFPGFLREKAYADFRNPRNFHEVIDQLEATIA
jgi:hypothetical protein